jgi:hypothetical protein
MTGHFNYPPSAIEMLNPRVAAAANPPRDCVLRSRDGTRYVVDRNGTHRRVNPKPLSKKARWRQRTGGKK